MPLLTVLAGRTEPGDWLTRFPAATTVRLGPLSRPDAVTLAEGSLARSPSPPRRREFFVDRASGNPLYLRELVSMARARDLLVDDGDELPVDGARAVPPTLQALLAARLDALEPEQKLAFQHLAVMGEATAQSSGSGAGTRRGELRSLVDSGLMRTGSTDRYDAVDSLLREVAYETLPRNVRGELHRRAAGVFERPEGRARHLDRAADYLADDPRSLRSRPPRRSPAPAGAVRRRSATSTPCACSSGPWRWGVGGRRCSWSWPRSRPCAARRSEALRHVALIEDDPDDPAVAIERDHAAANAKVFTDPASALPRLQDVAERWPPSGRRTKRRGDTPTWASRIST